MADGQDERARVRARPATIAGPSDVAPLEHRLARVEPEARRLLVGAVALTAMLGQDRPDLRLEPLVARISASRDWRKEEPTGDDEEGFAWAGLAGGGRERAGVKV